MSNIFSLLGQDFLGKEQAFASNQIYVGVNYAIIVANVDWKQPL